MPEHFYAFDDYWDKFFARMESLEALPRARKTEQKAVRKATRTPKRFRNQFHARHPRHAGFLTLSE